MSIRIALAFVAGSTFVLWLFALMQAAMLPVVLFGTATTLATLGAVV